MHVCKPKRRKTRFMGHDITTKACTSCHTTKEDINVTNRDGDVFTLPKGSILPHIQKAENEWKAVSAAYKESKHRNKSVLEMSEEELKLWSKNVVLQNLYQPR